MLPKTTCRPSKKLSPTIITVVPPVVHPSLGQIALIDGVAAEHRNPATAPTKQYLFIVNVDYISSLMLLCGYVYFATKAANIKIEKTDRQTEKLSTEITEQKTEIKTATNAT